MGRGGTAGPQLIQAGARVGGDGCSTFNAIVPCIHCSKQAEGVVLL